MSDPSPWIWRDHPFTENDVGDWFGFVYEITNTITGRRYIGRKYFYSTNRVKQKGKKNRKVVRKQSDWQKYYGSSKTLIDDVNKYGKENFKREILSLHEGRGDVNYHELKEQIVRDVLNDDSYYNDNIFTRFFRKKNKTKSEFKS
jgi:hypothetical protein